ncbi:CAP domain-containing protein [Salinicoccus sp. YB14-2]|uniref:CAP domain-containing protein n=1 Tax=Salinicoccus sp. YB14-2 TaxID=1572701 RepID=UPI00068A725D|nr:CAP domain-containing protein [Salinicoccus sp. YB14-2]
MLIIAAVLWAKPYWEDPVENIMSDQVSDTLYSVRDSTGNTIENIDFDFNTFRDRITSFFSSFTDAESLQEQVEPIELTDPEEQQFAVGNVEIDDTKESVDESYDEPERISENEYGVYWSVYHENYQNFMMVAYDAEETVCGLYTNQDVVSSQADLTLGDSKEAVHETLGKPEDFIQSGPFNYQVSNQDEYDVYQKDGNHTTIFYDVHQENSVTAVQIIDENLENEKDSVYFPGSESLREGFEYQLFDLTNAARAKHDLEPLEWHAEVSETARKHSADMAKNEYFNHTNLDGQSPFDRMNEDDISYTTAGENLAAAQFSSIYAHHGLMNSEGHRQNILNDSFRELGVGVAFDEDNRPFYTENFLRNLW